MYCVYFVAYSFIFIYLLCTLRKGIVLRRAQAPFPKSEFYERYDKQKHQSSCA